jgi:hypothetical protein
MSPSWENVGVGSALDIVVDGGMIGGRQYTPHQEGLRALRSSLGISQP